MQAGTLKAPKRIYPGKIFFQKVSDQISSIWGSTALKIADQSNRSAQLLGCAQSSCLARPCAEEQSPWRHGFRSQTNSPSSCKQEVQKTRNCHAQREHCWALLEILCIYEWTSIFWHRQPIPCGIKQPREMGTTLLLWHVCIFRDTETQSAQRRSSPLVSTEPERLFLFCLTLSKKREVFPKSRIIYSRDQKASRPENFFLMQLCRCHSIDMSKERELGKITWMSLIIQHDWKIPGRGSLPKIIKSEKLEAFQVQLLQDLLVWKQN